jgi:hypothetical protein
MICAQGGVKPSLIATGVATRLFIELPFRSLNATVPGSPGKVSNDRSPTTGRPVHAVPRDVRAAASGRTQPTNNSQEQVQ